MWPDRFSSQGAHRLEIISVCLEKGLSICQLIFISQLSHCSGFFITKHSELWLGVCEQVGILILDQTLFWAGAYNFQSISAMGGKAVWLCETKLCACLCILYRTVLKWLLNQNCNNIITMCLCPPGGFKGHLPPIFLTSYFSRENSISWKAILQLCPIYNMFPV